MGWPASAPGRCGRPQAWTSACAWASTRGTCCAVSSGCASGSTTCGPTTCPWPTGWRRPESLGEAQLAGGRVRGHGADCGLLWRGVSMGLERESVTPKRGALAWAPVCSALLCTPERALPPSLGALLLCDSGLPQPGAHHRGDAEAPGQGLRGGGRARAAAGPLPQRDEHPHLPGHRSPGTRLGCGSMGVGTTQEPGSAAGEWCPQRERREE